MRADGPRITALRQHRGMTQDKLAHEAGLSLRTDYWNAHPNPFVWGRRRRHRPRRQPGIALMPKAA
jgi:hypothetical protein